MAAVISTTDAIEGVGDMASVGHVIFSRALEEMGNNFIMKYPCT
jgi:hypothetical protein